jgi:quinol monooxygenase YgiN
VPRQVRQEAGLETSLRQLITQSRQEDGCLLYEILKSKRNRANTSF